MRLLLIYLFFGSLAHLRTFRVRVRVRVRDAFPDFSGDFNVIIIIIIYYEFFNL